MEAPVFTSRLPMLAIGCVVGWDVSNHAVWIEIPSMQQVGVSAKVLINGPCDYFRAEQNPLPVNGTWGLVAFPSGDTKSAIWLGAYSNSAVNAFTNSNPPQDLDSQIKYMSHSSGTYSLLDQGGNYYYASPDGTNFRLSIENQIPTTYKHYINDNIQTLVAVTPEVRNPAGINPPPTSSFYVSVNHPSGATITINPTGDYKVVGPTSANGASFEIAPDGTTTFLGATQSGISIILHPSGEIDINSGKDINILSGADISIRASGNILLQSGGNIDLSTDVNNTSVDQIVSTYNEHTHGGVTTGSSNTNIPNQPIP